LHPNLINRKLVGVTAAAKSALLRLLPSVDDVLVIALVEGDRVLLDLRAVGPEQEAVTLTAPRRIS
jgi:hypothetical protein